MQNIEKFLENTIRKYTGVQITDKDKNILGAGVMPLEFLYVINEIEKTYGVVVKDLFRDEDYTLMSIHNLSEKIYSIIA